MKRFAITYKATAYVMAENKEDAQSIWEEMDLADLQAATDGPYNDDLLDVSEVDF